eukprot:scaffold11279_cov65-Phaeocystis_antarctica.AAC.2
MQARLSATFEGAPPCLAAGGAAAAASAASLSAFSAASAARTSLVAAPRSGCCARSLASSGLKPRSGSATRSPRTASRRASGLQGSHMRGAPAGKAPAAGPAASHRLSTALSHGLAKFERGETRNVRRGTDPKFSVRRIHYVLQNRPLHTHTHWLMSCAQTLLATESGEKYGSTGRCVRCFRVSSSSAWLGSASAFC